MSAFNHIHKHTQTQDKTKETHARSLGKKTHTRKKDAQQKANKNFLKKKTGMANRITQIEIKVTRRVDMGWLRLVGSLKV